MEIYFKNHSTLYETMFQNLIESLRGSDVIRNEAMVKRLVDSLNVNFLGVTVYLTVLGSWSSNSLHYPPYGLIRISDSHSLQLLIELNGNEDGMTKFAKRQKVCSFLSSCQIPVLMLIQISVVVSFALRSEIECYPKISDLDHIELLRLLEIRLDQLLTYFHTLLTVLPSSVKNAHQNARTFYSGHPERT